MQTKIRDHVRFREKVVPNAKFEGLVGLTFLIVLSSERTENS